MSIFETSLRRGKFDESRKLSNGSLMEFAKIYPMDAVYDSPEDVPEEVHLPAVLSFHSSDPLTLTLSSAVQAHCKGSSSPS